MTGNCIAKILRTSLNLESLLWSICLLNKPTLFSLTSLVYANPAPETLQPRYPRSSCAKTRSTIATGPGERSHAEAESGGAGVGVSACRNQTGVSGGRGGALDREVIIGQALVIWPPKTGRVKEVRI